MLAPDPQQQNPALGYYPKVRHIPCLSLEIEVS